jgi:hypothetical protein
MTRVGKRPSIERARPIAGQKRARHRLASKLLQHDRLGLQLARQRLQ